MPSVGSIIRTARLQAGLSLEQVSAKTCIATKALQAIEDDDLSPFSSSFFYKSFVRQFARELNLDYDSLVPLIQAASASMPEPVMPGKRPALIEKAIRVPGKHSHRSRWLWPVGSLVTVLGICCGLYTFWENSKSTDSDAARSPQIVTTDRDSAAQAEPATSADGFQVEISGIERSWLALAADGRQIFNGFLEPDQTKILRWHERGRIRTGNAGGVSLVFNGKPIGVAGPRGQIRTVVFMKDNYQVIQPAANVASPDHSMPLVHILHLGSPAETALLPLQRN